MGLASMVILLGAIRAVAGNPRTVRMALAFAVVSFLSSVVAMQYDTASVRLFGMLVYVVFFSVTFGAMLPLGPRMLMLLQASPSQKN